MTSSAIPFSPLTASELIERAAEQTELIGYRARSAVQMGDRFDEFDLQAMLEQARLANDYADAYKVRVPAASRSNTEGAPTSQPLRPRVPFSPLTEHGLSLRVGDPALSPLDARDLHRSLVLR